MKMYVSKHAWQRYRQRYPESKIRNKYHLEKHLNKNLSKEIKNWFLNGKDGRQSVVKVMGMYLPTVRRGNVLVVKTIIPPWLQEGSPGQKTARITFLEGMIMNLKDTRSKRIKKYVVRFFYKLRYKLKRPRGETVNAGGLKPLS